MVFSISLRKVKRASKLSHNQRTTEMKILGHQKW